MPIDWFWSKQRTIVCPDGTTQYVFKNVDDAFPFFFRQAKMSAEGAVDGLQKVKGKIEAKYESQIKHILVSIDEKNGSVQAHLRAAYVLYSAAPCKKLDYLQAAIEAVRQDERDLRAAEMAIQQLVTLLSTPRNGHGGRSDPENPDDPSFQKRISEHLGRVLSVLNHRSTAVMVVDQMRHVSQNTQEWVKP